jgi:cytochrome b
MNGQRWIEVWDPLVRSLHWLLAAAVLTAYLSSEENRQIHEIAGLVVIAILTVRSLWGMIGPPHARFAEFVRPPEATIGYLRGILRREAPRYLGHNPAGAAMILLLFGVLLATALTGVLTVRGDLPRRTGKEIHELLGNAVLVLAALHVLGVAVTSLMHRENLVRAMLTGRKAAEPSAT